MKNFKSLLTAAIAASFLLVSCEEITTNSTAEENEGFLSGTNSSDYIEVDESEKEVIMPILTMSYKEGDTRADSEAEWEKKVEEFIAQQSKSRAAYKVYVDIYTKTGTVKNADTDGRVELRFSVNEGGFPNYTPYFKLDNPGNDREKGQTDHYLFGFDTGKVDGKVSFRDATLKLKGKDGWYITDYRCKILPNSQVYSCNKGVAQIGNTANIWLDNRTSIGWDRHRENWKSGSIYFY